MFYIFDILRMCAFILQMLALVEEHLKLEIGITPIITNTIIPNGSGSSRSMHSSGGGNNVDGNISHIVSVSDSNPFVKKPSGLTLTNIIQIPIYCESKIGANGGMCSLKSVINMHTHVVSTLGSLRFKAQNAINC